MYGCVYIYIMYVYVYITYACIMSILFVIYIYVCVCVHAYISYIYTHTHSYTTIIISICIYIYTRDNQLKWSSTTGESQGSRNLQQNRATSLWDPAKVFTKSGQMVKIWSYNLMYHTYGNGLLHFITTYKNADDWEVVFVDFIALFYPHDRHFN